MALIGELGLEKDDLEDFRSCWRWNGVVVGFLIPVPKCTLPLLCYSVPCQAIEVSASSQHHGFLQKLQWKKCQGTKVSNVDQDEGLDEGIHQVSP